MERNIGFFLSFNDDTKWDIL